VSEAARRRFAATAERVAARAGAQADELRRQVLSFVELRGDERVLDAGTGTGALAFALAPHVREVVGVDVVPELLALGRERAPANVELVEGDVTRLPFERASFDLAATLRTLHHVRRPELVVAELARVTRPGGRVLVVDQLGATDPLISFERDRFERARDPSHQRLLPDGDLRALFEANGLVLRRERFVEEERPLAPYLELAGCEGEDRERALALAPADPYRAELGWYLLARP
jgi:SAM-dependent methyltransferase